MRIFLSVFIVLMFFAQPLLADKAPPLEADYQAKQVADGVYVIHGPKGVPTPENQGFMNNPAFMLTAEGVVVVDPGSSVQVGEMVLSRIRKVTDKPVVAVFDTHVHGDHWLGNQAMLEAFPGIRIYAHPRMMERVEQGAGAQWLDVMMDMTGGATAGTKVVSANSPVDEGSVISIGGLDIHVLHDGKSHTDNDIMLHLPQKGVIFLGDNAGYGRMLRLNDGSFQGNIRNLNRAVTTGAKVFVPGHGPTAGPEAATEYRDYLQAVYDGVKGYFEDDLSDFEIKPRLLPSLARWKDWTDFDSLVGSHVSLAYLEVEAAEF
jgi:glyoxylase-like metal-dependent hydrolase (beta-lactamase superfamily II)